MRADQFDAITRSLPDGRTRRGVLGGLAAFGVALIVRRDAETKRGKRKKSARNAFGCLNVGAKCRGKDHKCCSGLCAGKKPKKGERDKRRCIGHDATTCQVGQQACGVVDTPCTASTGTAGFCVTTTGNAAYCATGFGGECFSCRKDADCRANCGKRAACVQCATCPGGTTCATADASNTCTLSVIATK
jgi:hypothetical protein